ncbi:MAG: hypothetical protein LBQ95_07365 [Lachnospiraceae bacterium]|jgi:hypothetical protein|nr:hypothetical protein [Lachnospiraceae bacterium]
MSTQIGAIIEMDEIKEGLIRLFTDAHAIIKNFRKRTFSEDYEALKAKDGGVVFEIEEMISASDNKDALIDEVSKILPEYVAGLPKKASMTIDYNMSMAAYVIPILTSSKSDDMEVLADKTIKLWNEIAVKDLKLSKSNYEMIAGGFKKHWFCFITTAVCESENKPDDCYELRTLRGFRDDYLNNTKDGKALVSDYYDRAPALVMAIDMRPDKKEIYKDILNTWITPCVGLIEKGKNEECKRNYIDMVNCLFGKYYF